MKSEDYFGRFLKATLRPFRMYYRCSAGISAFAVDANENIIICPAFIGEKEGIIGNLDNGIDLKYKEKFETLYADKIEYCKNCWARYTCGGECFAVGFNSNKIFEKPNPIMCELKKYLIQLAIYFWTSLGFEHRELDNKVLEKY